MHDAAEENRIKRETKALVLKQIQEPAVAKKIRAVVDKAASKQPKR